MKLCKTCKNKNIWKSCRRCWGKKAKSDKELLKVIFALQGDTWDEQDKAIATILKHFTRKQESTNGPL